MNVESLGNITPDEDIDIDVTSPTTPGIKLKIKLGGETMGTSRIESRYDIIHFMGIYQL